MSIINPINYHAQKKKYFHSNYFIKFYQIDVLQIIHNYNMFKFVRTFVINMF